MILDAKKDNAVNDRVNAVRYVKKRYAPRCIHKMQAILSVYAIIITTQHSIIFGLNYFFKLLFVLSDLEPMIPEQINVSCNTYIIYNAILYQTMLHYTIRIIYHTIL